MKTQLNLKKQTDRGHQQRLSRTTRSAMVGGKSETPAMASPVFRTQIATTRTATLASALTLPEHARLGGHQKPIGAMMSSATMTTSVRAGLALIKPALALKISARTGSATKVQDAPTIHVV